MGVIGTSNRQTGLDHGQHVRQDYSRHCGCREHCTSSGQCATVDRVGWGIALTIVQNAMNASLPTVTGVSSEYYYVCPVANETFGQAALERTGPLAVALARANEVAVAASGISYPRPWPMDNGFPLAAGCNASSAVMFPMSHHYPHATNGDQLFFGSDNSSAAPLQDGQMSTADTGGSCIVVDEQGHFCSVVEDNPKAGLVPCIVADHSWDSPAPSTSQDSGAIMTTALEGLATSTTAPKSWDRPLTFGPAKSLDTGLEGLDDGE